MADKAEEQVSQLQPTQQRKHSGINKAEWIDGYGPYRYCKPTPHQIIAYFADMRISGTIKKRGDIQSDDIGTPPVQMYEEDLTVSVEQFLKELSNHAWGVWQSFADEEMTCSVAIEEQVSGQAVDTETDDVSQWTSDQLASSLMHPEAKVDMPHLREMILIAEDTGFTVDQSKPLAPWLLSFAERYRDSSDPQDEAAVWSAIRTGASMLRPHDADYLRPLLEPGHSIETSLVTVKMLGRIFEAQPPAEVDEHQDMANEVCQIAESSLNPHVITASQIAAKAQLAIYALAAMASSKTEPIVEAVQKLGVTWFTRRTLRKLRDLSNTWANHPTAVREAPRQLLDKVLQMLERDRNARH